MKYIVTESQKKNLEELTAAGAWGKTDVDSKLFSEITDKFADWEIIDYIREYFENVIGKDTSEIYDDEIINYFHYTRNSFLVPKYFKTADVISGLGYFLAKKAFRLKKGKYGLSYFLIEDSYDNKYYFFDDLLQLTIGYMSTIEISTRFRHPIYRRFPKGTHKVSLSMIDDKLTGMGYGKSMYLTVIDTLPCLMSDEILYRGSLNMWVNVIPKYLPSAGYITDENEVVKLPTKAKLKYRDIDCFFASKNPNVIKKFE